jgi:L-rhamnose mutarotase
MTTSLGRSDGNAASWQESMSSFMDAHARPDETFVELEEYFHLD